MEGGGAMLPQLCLLLLLLLSLLLLLGQGGGGCSLAFAGVGAYGVQLSTPGSKRSLSSPLPVNVPTLIPSPPGGLGAAAAAAASIAAAPIEVSPVGSAVQCSSPSSPG